MAWVGRAGVDQHSGQLIEVALFSNHFHVDGPYQVFEVFVASRLHLGDSFVLTKSAVANWRVAVIRLLTETLLGPLVEINLLWEF